MKKLIFLFALLWPFCANAQVITSFAGGGIGGDGNPATAASIYDPNGSAFDKYGNFYFTEKLGNKIRKIDVNGIISTVAGNGVANYNGDNIEATDASLKYPEDIAIDSMGDLYIADEGNNRIRKVDIGTGLITTVAGTGQEGYSGDGSLAINAKLNLPIGLCFDRNWNLYISDMGNYCVRKVTLTGIITTFAGTGVAGDAGDNGSALLAQFELPDGLTVDDSGYIYIGDESANRIRRVNMAGIITEYAGTGNYVYNGDNIAATNANLSIGKIVMNKSGDLFIADYYNNRIRKVSTSGIITTVAGNGIYGYSGDGGLAINAEFAKPYGVSLDSCSNLYISQVDTPRIRKVSFNPNCWPEGVSNVAENNEIKIYPNPATTELTITASSPDSYQGNSVQLINMLGQVVLQQKLSTQKTILNISSLPNGIYFIKVNNTYVQKVVKE